MKFLTWLLGVFVIYLGMELTAAVAPRWWWVWICSAIIWLFAGAGLGLVSLVKLATAKGGAGGLGGLARPPRMPSAPHKEE